jgi:putative membrane protein
MRKYGIAAAAALICSSAWGQSLGEQTGVNSALGVAPTTADFVKEAAMSDMFEIQASKLAITKSDQATKDFASQMVSDHTKTSKELTAEAMADNIPLPAAMDSSLQSKLDKLSGLNGNDFTKQYHDDQVSAHKDAVSLFERYGKSGDNAKLKAWAVQTLPTLQHHLEMAQALDK